MKEPLKRIALEIRFIVRQKREDSKFWILRLPRSIFKYCFHFCKILLRRTIDHIVGVLDYLFPIQEYDKPTWFNKNLKKNEGVRVILLWAQECKFNAEDFLLIKNVFLNFNGNKILIINCDCRTTAWHFPDSFKKYALISRKNLGYDWGGYKRIINELANEKLPFITILNNSISLNGSISELLTSQEDLATLNMGVSGLIESNYPTPHLQSFSLTFSKTSLERGIYQWINKQPLLRKKYSIVHYYEIGLGGFCRATKIPIIPVFSFKFLKEYALNNWERVLENDAIHGNYKIIYNRLRNDLSINPTHNLWRFLEDLRVPFIKRELLKKNPAGMPDIKLRRI